MQPSGTVDEQTFGPQHDDISFESVDAQNSDTTPAQQENEKSLVDDQPGLESDSLTGAEGQIDEEIVLEPIPQSADIVDSDKQTGEFDSSLDQPTTDYYDPDDSAKPTQEVSDG
jgi:hypothetical protein